MYESIITNIIAQIIAKKRKNIVIYYYLRYNYIKEVKYGKRN